MNTITKYFEGEKIQCTIGIIVAGLCLAVSIYFLFLQKPVLRGISFAFMPLSGLLILICISIVIRTPKDIQRVTSLYQDSPQKVKADEIPRMEKVMKSFSLLKKIEIGVFLIGLAMLLAFWNRDLTKGIALGLIIQGTLLYAFDHLAEARGKIYVEFLKLL